LRIENVDESIHFSNYDFLDADARPITGHVGGSEFPRIDIGNLEPSKRVSGKFGFETQRAINGVINLKIVSDQVVVFEKNVVIAITAPREMNVILSQTVFPSGIQNDINIVVLDRSSNLEIHEAIVKVKDRFGDVLSTDTKILIA